MSDPPKRPRYHEPEPTIEVQLQGTGYHPQNEVDSDQLPSGLFTQEHVDITVTQPSCRDTLQQNLQIDYDFQFQPEAEAFTITEEDTQQLATEIQSSSSPFKSSSSSPLKLTLSSPLKSSFSSPTKCLSSSPMKCSSSSPTKCSSLLSVKSISSSLSSSSPPHGSSHLNVSLDSETSDLNVISVSSESKVVDLPKNCAVVTDECVMEQQVLASQLSAKPPQQPTLNVSSDMDDFLESNLEATVDVQEPEVEEELLGHELPEEELPEEELREVLSLMTVADESFEFEPEAYEYDSSPAIEGDPPLYEGASLSFHESLVAILTFVLSFRLTGACLKALLDLIFLHLPKKDSVFTTSLSAFKNYFSYIQGPKDFKYYCSKCFKELPVKSKCTVCKKSKVCYLVKLSTHQQLQALLQRPGFYSNLQFNHTDQVPGQYSDVYSGNLYQDLLKKNTLGKDVLTFQWYTDGAALYSSSQMSVWPVYLSINEIPYGERFKKENLLVPVIWCGPVKPPGNLLVDSMYEDLSSLLQGEKFNVPDEGEKIIRGVLLNGTGDTPARSLMLNMVQFNGASSCQVCEQEGECRPGCPGVRLFPFREDEMIPRTLANMKKYMTQGTELHPVKGVKGVCALDSVMPNYILGMAVDFMHQLYGGVNKKVLLLLLSPKQEAKKWSISVHESVLDSRLLEIKPPAHVARLPRSLKEVHYWKMNELKSWLNDYSLPVLNGVVSDQYLLHHASLVAAVHLLNADEVLSESLTTAENLLKKYVSQFSDFYDPNYLTMNFHLLLHLPQIVATLGPGWVHTCFPLESINGVILNLVHGTRWAEKQIATSVQTCLALPEIVSKLPESEAKQFCSKIMNRRKYQGAEVVNGSAIIGKIVLISKEDIPPHIANILKTENIEFKQLKLFHSLKRGKFLYVALSSKVSVCRDSSAAVFNQTNVGFIETFLRVYNCNCNDNCSCDSKIYALVQKCEVLRQFKTLLPQVFVPNVAEYKKTNTYALVCPTNLKGACTVMNINHKLYISKPTNTMEVE